ncbi:MAG TPA: PQQ-dependent sugar dehydrogenase, partial [Gammaproteobacteria bacterium]|nr:PQQ-dependent sugar dehydrogenase [Gammaproteobacteria bacterium]
MLITTQPGQLRVYQNGALLATPALDLSKRVCSNRERGMLGVAVDPAFVQNRFVYLYYTFKRAGSCEYTKPSATSSTPFTATGPVNRISRFVLG